MAKRCKVCRTKFEPRNSLEAVCGFKCALAFTKTKQGKAHVNKAYRAETRERRAKLKSRQDWLNDVQVVFNRYIRLRDKDNACISCGRSTGCKVNAGHYRSVGAAPELRFCEDNVHLQCEHCNCFNSGAAIDYRIGLIQKIGAERVGWLEGPHDPKRYTIEDLKALKKEYQAKIKELTVGSD